MDKQCKSCAKKKPEDRFSMRQTVRGPVRRGVCKDCQNERSRSNRDDTRREWERNHHQRKKQGWKSDPKPANLPEDIAKQQRNWQLKNRYGLTLEEYQAMLNKQNGACAICLETFVNSKSTHVDHCHSTGRVRGLLCSNCNTAIGLLKDDPNRLVRATGYITSQSVG